VAFDENFQMFGMLTIASMNPRAFICFGPLFLHGALTCANIAQNPEFVSGPALSLINIGFLKNQLAKVQDSREGFTQMKFDMEVYMGVFLVVGIFLGMSNFLSVILYF